DEAVAAINDEPYGLASTVWCEDLGTAKWWSDRIRVGTLAVNGYSEGTVATPFGGRRQSGFWGRDNGPEALEAYPETMTVWIAPPWAGSGRSVAVAERWGGANRGGPGGGNRFCQGRVEGPTLRRCRHGSRRGRCEVLPRPRPGRHPGPCGQGARRRPHHGEPTGPTPRSRPGSAAVHPHPQRLDHQPQRREAAAGRPDGCPRQRRLHHRGLCADGSGGVDDPQPRRLRRQRADPGVRPPGDDTVTPIISAPSLAAREGTAFDAAIVRSRPNSSAVASRALADYEIGLYAHEDYLSEHGPIRSLDDLEGHVLAWYADDP